MHVHSTIVQRLIGVDRRLFDIAQIVHSRVFIILNLLTPTVIDEWKPKKKHVETNLILRLHYMTQKWIHALACSTFWILLKT